MSKFEAGDLVDYFGYKKCVVRVPDPDKDGDMVIEVNRTYLIVKQTELTPRRATQQWCGIEIDAFDTEPLEIGQRYWFFHSAREASCDWFHYCNADTDNRAMTCGYWLDEEKAKRSAPLMYARMVEMAKGGE